jgi:endonuclease-3
MSRKQTVLRVHTKLANAYGPLPELSRHRPLDSLVQTILSQNTSDVNSHRAYRSLRKAFPSWQQVEQAPPEKIAKAIHEGGLSQVKSLVIKRVLQTIRKREGRLSLKRLAGMEDHEAMEYLMSLPGVGVKTAACVLLFSLGRSVFPVDTHVYRTTRRLGWLDNGVRIEDATACLQGVIPGDLTLSLHLYLVQHGRETCKARNPRCEACCTSAHCETYRKGRS